MFEGFEHIRVKTMEAEIETVKKGSGPPLLLVHGYPQTKAMWHKIAPDLAERFTGADPEYFIRHMLGTWTGTSSGFSDEALAEYIRCFKDPEVIHASCEDYRAGAFVDCQLDEEDLKAGRKITCPVLAIWGDRGRSHKRRQVLETWRRWAVDVQGEGLPCGHFLAEEAPEATQNALQQFFAG